MQTEIADEMMENGMETDSYARSRVVPEYNPSSYSWLYRLRHAGTKRKKNLNYCEIHNVNLRRFT